MKTKWAITLLALILTLGISPQLFSQTNLNNLLKQCETKNTVDMNVVMDRNRETGEISRIVRNVTINNDKRLVDDFLAAFSRDKDKADKIIENIRGGRTIPSMYQFSDGEKRISYTFSLSDDSNATVTYIERTGGGSSFSNIFSFNSEEFKQSMEKFGRDMEAWSAEYAPKIEAWAKEFGEKMGGVEIDQIRVKMNDEERYFRGLPPE